MNVACRTSSPSTLASRTRSSGARLLRSMRTKSIVRLLLMSTLAAVVSTQWVSKYVSPLTLSLRGVAAARAR